MPPTNLERLVADARTYFHQEYGREPDVVACAPGRVNLIGEHTDYNDGYVFPVAIDRFVVVALARTDGDSIAVSKGFSGRAAFSVTERREMSGWERFPSGVAWTLAKSGHRVSNAVSVAVSDLPVGSGLSSSAATELAYLCAWDSLDRLAIEPVKMALLAQSCEHEFIGVQCGIMDQFASALGRDGHAMLLDVHDLTSRYVPIPKGLSIVVCDTGKSRTLAGSAYNQRRAECSEACAIIGKDSLRQATKGHLAKLTGTALKRARHVVTENERCLQFALALQADDRPTMGRLMDESHESLRSDYEVSCPELDAMQDEALQIQGCIGARMTGAGFGGACVALVEAERTPRFMEELQSRFTAEFPGSEPVFLDCEAAFGARVL